MPYPIDVQRKIAAAEYLISHLRVGDRVRVTSDGRTSDMIVSVGPRRSDGKFGDPLSLCVTVTYGPGRYAREVSVGHLVRTPLGRGHVGGTVEMEKLP